MSKGLQIAKNFSMPIDAVTQTFAILAMRGAGKTYTGGVMAEEMLRLGVPIVVLDPIGVWWGLRSSANGKKAGFPIVIFGGERGDHPLTVESAEMIAQAIVEKRFSAILDLSLFRKMESKRFVAVFLETLYRLNREAIHCFIDEVDTFCPQRVMGEDARVVGAVEDVFKKGRARGIGGTMITQRASAVNKNAFTQCDTLIAMHTVATRDIVTIKDWTQDKSVESDVQKVIQTLPKLKQGEAWLWSPSFLETLERIKIREKTTFNSSSTPKAGERRATAKTLAEIDLTKLGEEIRKSAEAAKENSPDTLRRKIAALEGELKIAYSKNGKAAPPKINMDEFNAKAQSMFQVELEKQISLMRTQVDAEVYSAITEIGNLIPTVRVRVMKSLERSVQGLLKTKIAKISMSVPVQAATAPTVHAQAFVTETKVVKNTTLSNPQLTVLKAVYWCSDETPNMSKISFYSNYSKGTVKNYLADLRSGGYVQGFKLTEAGHTIAVEIAEAKPTSAALREWLRGRLNMSENACVDRMLQYPHGEVFSSQRLVELTNYSPGTIKNILAVLRTLEVVSGMAADGGVKLHSSFFS